MRGKASALTKLAGRRPEAAIVSQTGICTRVQLSTIEQTQNTGVKTKKKSVTKMNVTEYVSSTVRNRSSYRS